MPSFGRKKKQAEPEPASSAFEAPPPPPHDEDTTSTAPTGAGAANTAATPSDVVVGAADFQADQPGDLGFKTGDRIVVTAKLGDWWEGHLESDPAKIGQFPSNYVVLEEVDGLGAEALRNAPQDDEDRLGAEAPPHAPHDEAFQDLVDAVTDSDLAKLDKCLNEVSDLHAVVNEPFEDGTGTTLLWLACQLGHRDIVDRLIAAGSDVDGVTFDESTPLHAAAEYGHAQCLEALLEARASVDVADDEGNTPLIASAQAHAYDCVQVLLSHGAGPDFENDAGMTALDVARHCVESEGSTPELEDVVHALETAAHADCVSHEEVYGGFDSDIPRTHAGSQLKRWKVAAKVVVAVGRMQRTILFIISNQGERHAVEVLGETTLAQLQQKAEALLNIPVEHQELMVKEKPVATKNTSARLSQLGIEARAEIVVHDRRQCRKDDVDAAAAVVNTRVVTSSAAAAEQNTGVVTSNAAALNFRSAETEALRAQVQQLQRQLQNLSQDKVAHAAAATHSEQQIHLLERARKAELMANMAVPSLPVPTYQERPPQRRGPVPQEPCEVDSKDFSTRTRSKLTERRYNRDNRYERHPPPDDSLAPSSPAEAPRRFNSHTSGADWQADWSAGPQIISVVPGDSSCTIIFRGTDERNTHAYVIDAQPVAQDAPPGRRCRRMIEVDEPQLQRSVTIDNLENFVEVLITVAAMSITGGEQLVACLGTPLPCVPSKPTVRDLRTTSTSIDISVHVPDPGGAPLTSLTARIQRSTETTQRVAAVIPATNESGYTISIPGLASGARYAVAVSASNTGGESEQAVFWASTSPLLPRAVTLISATAADSSVEFLFTLDDAAVVSHVTILTQEPGEAEPRVATVLRTQDVHRTDPVRVCVAGLANWVRTEVFIVAGNIDGDGPACRFVCTPQAR